MSLDPVKSRDSRDRPGGDLSMPAISAADMPGDVSGEDFSNRDGVDYAALRGAVDQWDPAQLTQAHSYVRNVVARSKTSFGAGMRILPKKRREAMFAVYAFCRVIDDIADEPGELAQKLRELESWRGEIGATFRGQPKDPIAIALLEAIACFQLPRSEFLLLIEGMEWDARGPIIAPDFSKLRAYCRRVAGAVGQLSMPIFGAPNNEHAHDFAIAMGEGLQLANITRDVGEDAREGRLYLPRELLLAAGAPMEPAQITHFAGLPAIRAELAQEARLAFARADRALAQLPWRSVRPALVMRAVYDLTLQAMHRAHYRDLSKPRIHASRKIGAILGALCWPPARLID